MKLVPKTRKGKNRLHEAGTDEWRIVRRSDSVICFNGKPGILIEPVLEDRTKADNKSRWVLADNDPDFTWA
jgi:hypothetical protein